MVQQLRDSCCAPCLYWVVPTLMACGLGTNIAKNQHLYPKNPLTGNATTGIHTHERDFTLWRDCVRNDQTDSKSCDYLELDNQTPSADCGKFKRTTRTTRAFYIMTLILAVFALLALIAASCGSIGWLIPAILIVLVAIFGLIAIILACYLYDRADKPNGAFCNLAGSYVNGSHRHFELVNDSDARLKPDVGPSIPLMITAWFMNAFTGCWNCALKDGKEAFQKVSSEPHVHHRAAPVVASAPAPVPAPVYSPVPVAAPAPVVHQTRRLAPDGQPYEGAGPNVDGRTDALFKEGLAYKIVEDLGDGNEQWHMYNDTNDSDLRVEYAFGPQSVIEPIGAGKSEGRGEDDWLKLVGVVPPGKTLPFMRGSVNGYRGDAVLETLPGH